MAMVRIEELEAGDLIKSYSIFKDDKWHFVRSVEVDYDSSIVYLALEGYGHGQFDGSSMVEKQ